MQAEFERDLSKKMTVRRLITCIVCLLFCTLFIISCILRETSKVVIVHTYGFPIPSWTEVNYNNAYIPLILLGVIGAIFAGSFLFADLMLCGHKTIRKDMHYITIYKGMWRNLVYVDGKEEGRIEPFSHSNVVEVWLPNRVRVTISFSRVIWYMAHVSFSDDTASREV